MDVNVEKQEREDIKCVCCPCFCNIYLLKKKWNAEITLFLRCSVVENKGEHSSNIT